MTHTIENLNYSDDGVDCIGKVAIPTGNDARPGIAIFGDITGLSEQIVQRAARIADELGYIALAADVYGGGKLITDMKEGSALVSAWFAEPQRLARRAAAALDALAAHPHCNGKLGAIGYCFGGGTILALGRSGLGNMRAGVSFHGVLKTPAPAQPGAVSAKLLVCHGSDDPFAPDDTILDFIREMSAAGADCQTAVFSGVGHSFTNPKADGSTPGAKYDAATDTRSWKMMTNLFDEVFSS